MSEIIKNDADTLKITSQNTQTVELSPGMQESIKDALLIYLRTNPDMVRDVIRDSLLTQEEVFLKEIPRGEAKEVINQYITSNPGCKTSEIIMETCLEPRLVASILKELKMEETVRNESIPQ